MGQFNAGDRTPMIVHWPAGTMATAGSIDQSRLRVIDFAPMVLTIASATLPTSFAAKTPHALQGVSFTPLLTGEETLANHPSLFGEHEGGHSVITPDGYKLIRVRGEQAWHLYDLDRYQTESIDFIATQPDRAATHAGDVGRVGQAERRISKKFNALIPLAASAASGQGFHSRVRVPVRESRREDD